MMPRSRRNSAAEKKPCWNLMMKRGMKLRSRYTARANIVAATTSASWTTNDLSCASTETRLLAEGPHECNASTLEPSRWRL